MCIDEKLREVRIKREIFQGDSISPLLFVHINDPTYKAY